MTGAPKPHHRHLSHLLGLRVVDASRAAGGLNH